MIIFINKKFSFFSICNALRRLHYYSMFQDGSSKFSDGAINEQTRIDLKFHQSLSLTQLILLAELLRLLRMHYEDTVMPHTAAANFTCCKYLRKY